ncbi:short-chain dehydrogenase, partial [Escherichia coli]
PSAMSKAGVNVMSQSLAVEWADRGIRLNCIAPGTFPTEGMSARLRPTDGEQAFRDTTDYPMGRVGRMPELANLAAFLMS